MPQVTSAHKLYVAFVNMLLLVICQCGKKTADHFHWFANTKEAEMITPSCSPHASFALIG